MMQDLVTHATEHGHSTGTRTETFDLAAWPARPSPTMGNASELARVVLPQGRALWRGGKAAMERALVNLVGNALKYSTTGPIVVDVVRVDNRIRLTVSDQGREIAPDDIEHIFEEFERGTLATVDGGTGLGLTSVKGQVEEQGGSVHIHSVVGQGTIATVALPALVHEFATA